MKQMKKNYLSKSLLLTSLLLISVFFFSGCQSSSETVWQGTDQLKVVVTIDAMNEFAMAVGQDQVQIYSLIPSGTEPHDYTPKAADISLLSTADIFLMNGLGMESWADEAIQASENDSLLVIDSSSSITPITNTEEEEIEEHGLYDPHIWLSLKSAQVQVQNIADGFSAADPEHAAFYQENASLYIDELETLFDTYYEKFQSLENKNFVTGHAAFHYFCNDFGLVHNSVEDVFAEGEPSTKQLADLVDYCLANNVKTIFTEELASPEVSETLAKEVGANLETIYTIESPEDELTYLERMEINCQKIYESLSN